MIIYYGNVISNNLIITLDFDYPIVYNKGISNKIRNKGTVNMLKSLIKLDKKLKGKNTYEVDVGDERSIDYFEGGTITSINRIKYMKDDMVKYGIQNMKVKQGSDDLNINPDEEYYMRSAYDVLLNEVEKLDEQYETYINS